MIMTPRGAFPQCKRACRICSAWYDYVACSVCRLRSNYGEGIYGGGAKVAITPPLGSAFQSSRADLRVESVLHDLYATAVVLSDGERKVAIVGLDVLGLDAPLVNAVRKRVEQQTSIPGANVLINAAHNHFGPALLQALPDAIDEVYYQGLVQSLADAVTRAAANVEPVALRVGAAEGSFAINRRRVENGEAQLAPNYGGIVDQRIRALRFERLDGTIVAVLFSTAFPSDRLCLPGAGGQRRLRGRCPPGGRAAIRGPRSARRRFPAGLRG